MQTGPTPFALIGAGAMGYGLLHEALSGGRFMPAAIHETSRSALDRVAERVASAGQAAAIGLTTSTDEFLRRTTHARLLIDASSSIHGTAGIIRHFLDTGRHVFMMNSEADLAHGHAWLALAEARGVLYSSVDGDQHAVIKRLANRVESWGLRLVLLGNIKGFLDRRATPASVVDEARKRDLDPVMCCSYTDGTKLAIEMALLSNATGARVVRRGMTGPAIADVSRVTDHFDFDRLWNGSTPLIDYVLGANPDGGVFVVGYTDDPYRRKMLRYYKLGDGPYYVFVRPFHLCHVETLPAIEEALATSQPLVAPLFGRQSNVFTFAKRALRAGEILDGLGGSTSYGLIDDDSSDNEHLLPICESAEQRLTVDVPVDAPILRSACVAVAASHAS